MIYVEVLDTGKGIEQEHIERIFEPFVSSKEGGTGLGLAVCRSLVRAHGGDLHLVGGGEGAEFALVLPLESN